MRKLKGNDLKALVEKTAQCRANYIGSSKVKEIFKGKTVWDGEVEIFELIGHLKAMPLGNSADLMA